MTDVAAVIEALDEWLSATPTYAWPTQRRALDALREQQQEIEQLTRALADSTRREGELDRENEEMEQEIERLMEIHLIHVQEYGPLPLLGGCPLCRAAQTEPAPPEEPA